MQVLPILEEGVGLEKGGMGQGEVREGRERARAREGERDSLKRKLSPF